MRSQALFLPWLVMGVSTALASCGSPVVVPSVAMGAIGTVVGTGILGTTPGPEIKQVFYIGSFDPLGQLPPEVHRVTVRGQGSLLSKTVFASGWVPASVADALGSTISINSYSSDISIKGPDDAVAISADALGGGRRLVLFGPDGFRVAPQNYRLVIVMGSNADAFFDAVDGALGTLGRLRLAHSANAIGSAVMKRQQIVDAQRDALGSIVEELQRAIVHDLEAELVSKQHENAAKGSSK